VSSRSTPSPLAFCRKKSSKHRETTGIPIQCMRYQAVNMHDQLTSWKKFTPRTQSSSICRCPCERSVAGVERASVSASTR
jgi:hypothetical protein